MYYMLLLFLLLRLGGLEVSSSLYVEAYHRDLSSILSFLSMGSLLFLVTSTRTLFVCCRH